MDDRVWEGGWVGVSGWVGAWIGVRGWVGGWVIGWMDALRKIGYHILIYAYLQLNTYIHTCVYIEKIYVYI